MTSDRRALPRLGRWSSAARTAAGGLALTAAVSFAGAILAERAIAADAAQAVIAESGARLIGVTWGEADMPGVVAAKRALRGVAIGAGAAAFVLAVARATRAITSLTLLPSALGIGLVVLHAALVAVRDELLLRGVALRLLGGRPRWLFLAVSGAASGAWALGAAGADGLPLAELAGEALAGASLGALWLRERGPLAACGAHAAWVLLTRGALLATTSDTAWSGGGAGFLAGWGAAAALAPVVVAAVLWLRAGEQETSAPPPPVG